MKILYMHHTPHHLLVWNRAVYFAAWSPGPESRGKHQYISHTAVLATCTSLILPCSPRSTSLQTYSGESTLMIAFHLNRRIYSFLFSMYPFTGRVKTSKKERVRSARLLNTTNFDFIMTINTSRKRITISVPHALILHAAGTPWNAQGLEQKLDACQSQVRQKVKDASVSARTSRHGMIASFFPRHPHRFAIGVESKIPSRVEKAVSKLEYFCTENVWLWRSRVKAFGFRGILLSNDTLVTPLSMSSAAY